MSLKRTITETIGDDSLQNISRALEIDGADHLRGGDGVAFVSRSRRAIQDALLAGTRTPRT